MYSDLNLAEQVASIATSHSVNFFAKLAASSGLVLRPAFQRNLVWNPEQKSYLIDSILRGLPVPEIYVQYSIINGDDQYTIVDGQQRLSTCLEYLRNDFVLNGNEGKCFSELLPAEQDKVRSYQLIVRTLPPLHDDGLRQVFRRLNRTVEALEPQELRHAAYGSELVALIEQVSSLEPMSGLGVFTALDVRRRRNDELLAEILLAMYSGAYPNKKDGLEEFFIAAEQGEIRDQDFKILKQRLGRVLFFIFSVHETIRRTRFRNKSDFYTLCTVLGTHAEQIDFELIPRLESALIEFSERVNILRKTDPSERSPDDPASVYASNVEKAASDRLSRVRRAEVLRAVLEPILRTNSIVELSDSDVATLTDEPNDDSFQEEEPGGSFSTQESLAGVTLRSEK